MEEKDLISVIVPVYNVEEYLNQCIESIINQTYSRLEIILVNDGSTDNSEMLCRQWEKKDSRICVISQSNQGLAEARNVGVDYSHGEYFVFIDSDDWISENYVQYLYRSAIKKNADIVVCNYFGVIDKEEYLCGQELKKHVVESTKQKADFLLAGHTCMWSKMYKASFYKENQVRIPRVCCEDLAVFPLLVYLSGKIACIEEALYFYRVNREGSIMSTDKSVRDFPQALSYSIQLVRERFGYTYLDRFILLLQIINARFMLDRVNARGYLKDQFALLRENIINVWDEYFGDGKNYIPQSIVVFGSFNTRWITHRILYERDGLIGYYGFTSLIAQFIGNRRQENFQHENGFRQKMVRQDWGQNFIGDICKSNPDFLFIDFMEEVKNDIIITEEGEYLTDSEALRQINDSRLRMREILSWMGEQFFSIWKQACNKFVDMVDRYYDRRKVVLVKLRYAKYYLDDNKKEVFQNQEEIREKNNRIVLMEKYFQDRCRGAYVIEIPEEYFYNKEERYDKDAYYLNGKVYDFVVQEWIRKITLEEHENPHGKCKTDR